MEILRLISEYPRYRATLEKKALEAVCACQYYDLADCMDATSDKELIDIINYNYDCELCGLKGAN